MTHSVEHYVEIHNKLKDEHGGGHFENCSYTVFAEGYDPLYKQTVCWQFMRQGMSYFDQYDDEGDSEGAYENAPIHHLVVDLESFASTCGYCHKDRTALRMAQRNYLAFYLPLLMEGQTVDAIMEQGCFVVDLTRPLDVHCLGAFLLGFRNLSEQGYYRQFNLFTKEGFKPSQAIYLMHCFRFHDREDTTAMVHGATGHNVPDDVRWSNSWDMFIHLVNNCYLFNTDNFLTGRPGPHKQYNWGLNIRFNDAAPQFRDVDGGVFARFKVEERKTEWKTTYTIYTTDSIIEVLKKAFHEQ